MELEGHNLVCVVTSWILTAIKIKYHVIINVIIMNVIPVKGGK